MKDIHQIDFNDKSFSFLFEELNRKNSLECLIILFQKLMDLPKKENDINTRSTKKFSHVVQMSLLMIQLS